MYSYSSNGGHKVNQVKEMTPKFTRYFPIILVGCIVIALTFTPFQSEPEVSLTSTLQSMKGVGRVQIYIHQSEEQQGLFDLQTQGQTPTGVLVIAEGADQLSIKYKLRQTVASVLQIAEHRVIVEPMRGDSNEP